MTAERVVVNAEQSTSLATLYGRALDAGLADPILGDPTALDAVRRIDYDFGKFRMGMDQALAVALRAKTFDDWAGDFLAAHPGATVLHLGCGLDGRVYRLAPPPTVRWFDVDYPNVIALREKIYPERAGYRMIGSSVTDLGWMDEVPHDQPTLVVAEGLTMYLRRTDGETLLRTLVDTFRAGEMMFDGYSSAGIRLQRLNPVLRRSGATLHWGIDDARDLEKLGLTLLARLTAADFISPETRSRMSVGMRLQLRLLDLLPPLRNMGQLLRYQF